MAHPRLEARFFVDPKGFVVELAKPVTPSHATRIYERDGWVCQECGVRVKRGGKYDNPFNYDGPACGSIDHIVPRRRGGQNTDDNLRVLCKSCNCSKGADL